MGYNYFLIGNNFQGRDGPGLKDKLVELVRKKPGFLMDLQAPEPLLSIEQTMQPTVVT